MICGTPVVASDLPGVRQPVRMHHMGKIVPIGDSSAIALALIEILSEREKYRCDTATLAKLYDPDSVAAEYEKLFEELLR
jgi:glycosyltransferase involved in cell wall biosynthesis